MQKLTLLREVAIVKVCRERALASTFPAPLPDGGRLGKTFMASRAQVNLRHDDDRAASLHRFIAGFMSCAPGVERVLISADGTATHVWSIVNRLPPDGVYHLYACEDVLLDRFPRIPLDFHVVDRRDAPVEGLIPGAETVFAK